MVKLFRMSYDNVQVEVDSDNGIRSTEQVDEQPPSDYFVIFKCSSRLMSAFHAATSTR